MLTILADQCITQMRTSHDTSQHTRRDKAPSYSQPVRKCSPSCRSASLRHGEKSSGPTCQADQAKPSRAKPGKPSLFHASCPASRIPRPSRAVSRAPRPASRVPRPRAPRPAPRVFFACGARSQQRVIANPSPAPAQPSQPSPSQADKPSQPKPSQATKTLAKPSTASQTPGPTCQAAKPGRPSQAKPSQARQARPSQAQHKS